MVEELFMGYFVLHGLLFEELRPSTAFQHGMVNFLTSLLINLVCKIEIIPLPF